jgi:hypothetical protein
MYILTFSNVCSSRTTIYLAFFGHLHGIMVVLLVQTVGRPGPEGEQAGRLPRAPDSQGPHLDMYVHIVDSLYIGGLFV